MKQNGFLHGLSHFASLTIACLLTGMVINNLMQPSGTRTLLCMLVGGVLGWNWRKVTGFSIKVGGDENESK
jgi:hypothetical protein